jgi:sugar diacid utilization regulator
MSLTIEDILRLPCLREAKVLGGGGGLQNTVTSVSVLELTRANDLQENLYRAMDFLGGEIVITSFVDVKDNVDAQCVNMERLAARGEIGLILYYVGIIVPRVGEKLVALADRLNFPLIVMPPNPSLRYSEVITEVMEAIFKDQSSRNNFQDEILERLSRLPAYQQSVGNVMNMLSDRLKISLVLTDSADSVLNRVSWPRDAGFDIKAGAQCACIHTNKGTLLHVYLVKQDAALSDDAVKQAANVIKISLDFWNQKHGRQALPELVQAILHDEPYRMRSIASVYHIDVASIHDMWIVSPPKAEEQYDRYGSTLQSLLTLTREELSPYCKTIVADIYDQDVVALMDDPVDMELPPLAGDLLAQSALLGASVTICTNLQNTAQVRRSYLWNVDGLDTAKLIFPRKRVFSQQETHFACDCKNLLVEGEEASDEALAPLSCFDRVKQAALVDTVAVYLLDAESDLDKAAGFLALHRNSVKYRLTRVEKQLGFRLGRLPETMEIYRALAVRRVLAGMSPALP